MTCSRAYYEKSDFAIDPVNFIEVFKMSDDYPENFFIGLFWGLVFSLPLWGLIIWLGFFLF